MWAQGELRKVLHQVQSGELGVLAGCRGAVALIGALPPEIARSEAARVLVAVASEIDDLPFGDQLEGMAPAARATAEAEAGAYEVAVQDAVLSAMGALEGLLRA